MSVRRDRGPVRYVAEYRDEKGHKHEVSFMPFSDEKRERAMIAHCLREVADAIEKDDDQP